MASTVAHTFAIYDGVLTLPQFAALCAAARGRQLPLGLFHRMFSRRAAARAGSPASAGSGGGAPGGAPGMP
jgi:hypothetical protein